MKRFTLVSLISLGGCVAAAAACGSFGRDEDGPAPPADGGNGASSSGSADGGPNDVPFEVEGTDAACGVDPFVDLFEHTTSLHAEGWNDAVHIGGATIGPSVDPDAGNVLGAKFVKSSAMIQRAYFYRVLPQPTMKCQSWRYRLKFRARVSARDGDDAVSGPRFAATYATLDPGKTNYDNRVGVGIDFLKTDVALHLHDDACDQLRGCGDLRATGTILAQKVADTWHDYELDVEHFSQPQGLVFGKITVTVDSGPPAVFDLPFPLADAKLESELGVTYATGKTAGDLEIDNVSTSVVPAP